MKKLIRKRDAIIRKLDKETFGNFEAPLKHITRKSFYNFIVGLNAAHVIQRQIDYHEKRAEKRTATLRKISN